MNKIGILGALLVVWGLLTSLLMDGGDVCVLIQGSSGLIIFAPTMGLGLMAYGRDFLKALRALKVIVVPLKPDELSTRTVTILRSTIAFVHASGTLSIFMGAVEMLRLLDDLSCLGPALAAGLLAPFYSIVVAEILLRPAVKRIEYLAG